MSPDSSDLPIFPTTAPSVFRDAERAAELFTQVLERLAEIVDVGDDDLDRPTPCTAMSVGELRTHVLGWLGYFAAALSDPMAASPRPDPESFVLADGTRASDIVRRSSADIGHAIAAGAAGRLVTMTSSRMQGDGVLGMALGEYVIHAWDLAAATGRPYSAPDDVVVPAHKFLAGMIAPEYRGPDSGFFDSEVVVPDDASPLERLLGFAGRDPGWNAPVAGV
ncbi:MAG: TIGR03086 family metal-binding protein [Acidimicrobiales bacterium]